MQPKEASEEASWGSSLPPRVKFRQGCGEAMWQLKGCCAIGARNSEVGMMAGSSSDLQPLSTSAISRKSLLSSTERALLGQLGAGDAGAAAWPHGTAGTDPGQAGRGGYEEPLGLFNADISTAPDRSILVGPAPNRATPLPTVCKPRNPVTPWQGKNWGDAHHLTAGWDAGNVFWGCLQTL